MLHDTCSASVFGLIEELLDDLTPAAGYRSLFVHALDALRAAAAEAPIFLPIDLPLAIGDALGLADRDSRTAAAASALLWSGADVIDDIADGQLASHWNGESPHRIGLVSTNLLATLPPLLVGKAYGRGSPVCATYGQALARTLFVMSEGQWTDLGEPLRTLEDYCAMVRKKTAAEIALFASTPAILAGADGEVISDWVRFGFSYGTMCQMFSDTVSSVAEGPRNDILGGKRTLPVLQALSLLPEAEREGFRAALDSAASGKETEVDSVVERMTDLGALASSLEHIEIMRFRTFQALPVKLTDLSAKHPLRMILKSCSVL